MPPTWQPYVPKLLTILRHGYRWDDSATMRWPGSPWRSWRCHWRWHSPSPLAHSREGAAYSYRRRLPDLGAGWVARTDRWPHGSVHPRGVQRHRSLRLRRPGTLHAACRADADRGGRTAAWDAHEVRAAACDHGVHGRDCGGHFSESGEGSRGAQAWAPCRPTSSPGSRPSPTTPLSTSPPPCHRRRLPGRHPATAPEAPRLARVPPRGRRGDGRCGIDRVAG